MAGNAYVGTTILTWGDLVPNVRELMFITQITIRVRQPSKLRLSNDTVPNRKNKIDASKIGESITEIRREVQGAPETNRAAPAARGDPNPQAMPAPGAGGGPLQIQLQ